jgi:glutathione S-transferase
MSMADCDKPNGMELYGFWRTSATYRVRVAIALKGLAASEHTVDLDAGEQRSAGFLALNPLGAIPALIVPGQAPLTQSLAILEFLEEAHPEPPLLPADLHGRARVRSIALMLVFKIEVAAIPSIDRIMARCEAIPAFAAADPFSQTGAPPRP